MLADVFFFSFFVEECRGRKGRRGGHVVCQCVRRLDAVFFSFRNIDRQRFREAVTPLGATVIVLKVE